MTYSQSSLFNRLKATLPKRWFGDNTPVLDAVLNALSTGWVSLFNLLNYTITQTRIATATNSWLDLIAHDYFGDRIRRRTQEADGSFRGRIQEELTRDRCTRAAIYSLLLNLTGRAPTISSQPARKTLDVMVPRLPSRAAWSGTGFPVAGAVLSCRSRLLSGHFGQKRRGSLWLMDGMDF